MKKKPDKKETSAESTYNTALGTLGLAAALGMSDSTLRAETVSSKCDTSGMPYGMGYASSVPHTSYYGDIFIGGISLKYVLDKFIETLETKTDIVPKSNLDVVKQFNSEQMAHFILHDVRKCLTGAGDNLTELIEYLNSEPEI